MLRVRPRRIAAAAKPWTDGELAEREARQALEPHIDALCMEWSHWCATRKLYGPPAGVKSPLGNLARRTLLSTAPNYGGPDAVASRQLAVFHATVMGQPWHKDRMVFEAHYLECNPRRIPIKVAAHAFGIGRQHWYTLRNGFARRVYCIHQNLLDTV